LLCIWEKRNAYRVLTEKPKEKPNEKHYLEDIGIYGKIILKRVSNEWFGKM